MIQNSRVVSGGFWRSLLANEGSWWFWVEFFFWGGELGSLLFLVILGCCQWFLFFLFFKYTICYLLFLGGFMWFLVICYCFMNTLKVSVIGSKIFKMTNNYLNQAKIRRQNCVTSQLYYGRLVKVPWKCGGSLMEVLWTCH